MIEPPLRLFRRQSRRCRGRAICRWFDRGQSDKRRLHPFDIALGHFLEIDEGIPGHLVDADQLVQFQLHGLRVTRLRVLNHKDHEEGDNCRRGVDDQLPGIGPAKDRAGRGPENNDRDCEQERRRMPHLPLNPTGKPRK